MQTHRIHMFNTFNCGEKGEIVFLDISTMSSQSLSAYTINYISNLQL